MFIAFCGRGKHPTPAGVAQKSI